MAQLMHRAYTLSFVTMNILDQQHLITGFIEPARAYFLEINIPMGGGDWTWHACFPP